MLVAETLPEPPPTLETQQQLAELVLRLGCGLEGDPYLMPDPDKGQVGAMGLVFNDSMTARIYRAVQARKGNPGKGDIDFTDISCLRIGTRLATGEFTDEPLVIEGSIDKALALRHELQARLRGLGHIASARQVTYLGPEDPTWHGSNLMYTHAYQYPIDGGLAYWFALGQADGSNGNFREVDTPTFGTSRTGHRILAEHCKELAVNPRLQCEGKGMRWVAMERAYLGYSTVATARAPHDLNGPWEDFNIAIHPRYVAEQFREYYGDTNLSPKEQALQWAWIKDHVSPCAFVDIPDDVYKKHKGLQAAILSARSATTEDGKNGPFRIGIALFDPKTGSFPWIAPFPMSSILEGIRFASHYDPEAEMLYWHEDDTIVHRGPLTQATILGQLPRESQVERYYQEALR